MILSSPLGAAKTDISVKFDKTFDFASVRTWAWHPDGAGDVRMAITADDDPEQIAQRVDPIIVPAIERELAQRGLTTAPAAQADIHVHYYVLAAIKGFSQYQGQFLPAVPAWGLPPFSPATTALEVYPVGTVIIDLTTPATRAIVWRGTAEREIDVTRPEKERRKVLDTAIRDLIKKLPTTTKK